MQAIIAISVSKPNPGIIGTSTANDSTIIMVSVVSDNGG